MIEIFKSEPMPHSIILNELLQARMNTIEAYCEKILRTEAAPPIKGEITKGKITWRGIVFCEQILNGRTMYWMQQRGVKIGEYLVIDDFKLNNGLNVLQQVD